MALRKLKWTRKFLKNYQRLQAEALASLESGGKDRPMQRFLRVGETLRILAGVAGPPEDDRRLDTRPFLELSALARSAQTVHGSRGLEQPADFRIFWRQSQEEGQSLELIDLIWPCL
jgi:hypothetical protein